MKGFRRIFAFTFMQHIRTNSYKRLTITLAVLFFLLPVVIMGAVEIFSDDAGAETGMDMYAEKEWLELDTSRIEYVHVVDTSETHLVHFNDLVPGPEEGTYPYYEDVETALAEATPYTLVLLIEEDAEGNYTLTVILPKNTELTEEEAWAYQGWIDNMARNLIAYAKYPVWKAEKLILDTWEEMPEMEGTETMDAAVDPESTEDEDLADAKEIFSMILPYVNIMLLYFLVLFYGQGVANSVVMEKSSKLMDTFLVSVKPEAMIFGKVFAIAIAGMMQFLIWIAAVVLGLAGGTLLVRTINPDTQMAIIQLFDALAEMAGVFSVPGIILGLLMIFGGFILYCSLASIGGAIAGKAEDLSSTNMLFTMALVISFLCVLYAGGLEGMASSEEWLNWVPFTSIMITPSRLLLADIGPIQGLASMLLVYTAAVLVMWLAARVYKMMSLYSGKLPGLKKVFSMALRK